MKCTTFYKNYNGIDFRWNIYNAEWESKLKGLERAEDYVYFLENKLSLHMFCKLVGDYTLIGGTNTCKVVSVRRNMLSSVPTLTLQWKQNECVKKLDVVVCDQINLPT